MGGGGIRVLAALPCNHSTKVGALGFNSGRDVGEGVQRTDSIFFSLFGRVSGMQEFARWRRSIGWGETLAGCSTLDDTRLASLDVFRGLTIAVRREPHLPP